LLEFGIKVPEGKVIMSRLKEARLARGLSQQALADRCGLPRETISKIERCINTPTLIHAATVYAELGLGWKDAEADFEITTHPRR